MTKGTKFENQVGPNDKIQSRNLGVPEDYHCDCIYCTANFLGEIYCLDSDKHYSARANKSYLPKLKDKHICPGHFQGYRWPIQEFTKPGDLVFDPTVGTGTTVVEAMNCGRRGFGIELEFSPITKANVDYQYKRDPSIPEGAGRIVQGNAKDLSTILPANGIEEGSISLILNGTPYPKLGGKSSDAPERKNISKGDDGKFKIDKDMSFDYAAEDNFGTKKNQEYWDLINGMYVDCIPFLKIGGKLVIIIKDLVSNKKPYLLHKMIIDELRQQTRAFKLYGSYMHKHTPPTMFMNTYPKRFPEVSIPLYQVGIVLVRCK